MRWRMDGCVSVGLTWVDMVGLQAHTGGMTKTPEARDVIRAKVGHGRYVDGTITHTYDLSETLAIAWDDGDATICEVSDLTWDANIEGWRY